jgi:hypothetical protein
MQLSFKEQQFSWDILLAEVEFPILGVDFLCHYKLAVGATAGQLLHTETLQGLDTSGGGETVLYPGHHSFRVQSLI